ncbi:hypothetical protein [Janthinobacterium sp. TND4EL3]|nr:hypothetical protein [Janthinobacterium sp. TND4EL3]
MPKRPAQFASPQAGQAQRNVFSAKYCHSGIHFLHGATRAHQEKTCIDTH